MQTKHTLIALVCVAIVGFAVAWLLPAWRERERTREALAELEQQLLKRQTENAALRAEITRLKRDPATIERVAREKFGYCRPDEKVYDFSADE